MFFPRALFLCGFLPQRTSRHVRPASMLAHQLALTRYRSLVPHASTLTFHCSKRVRACVPALERRRTCVLICRAQEGPHKCEGRTGRRGVADPHACFFKKKKHRTSAPRGELRGRHVTRVTKTYVRSLLRSQARYVDGWGQLKRRWAFLV